MPSKAIVDCFFWIQFGSFYRFIWIKKMYIYISPLFNQVGQLRTSSHLQLRPGQDKAKQCDKKTTAQLHMG